MVQESDSRFCSDQHTILQVLDPIHRSLLFNNSEFECVNNNTTNPLTLSPTQTCKVFELQPQPKQQQYQREQQQLQRNLIENKHFYDASFSTKPDATYVSDSGCLMLFNEKLNIPDELECAVPSTDVIDTKQNFNRMEPTKNIQIRIVTNKKVIGEKTSMQRMSLESPTDSSSCEFVVSDSEVDSCNSAVKGCTVNSVGSKSSYKFRDYNDFQSSSNDEATTSSSEATTTSQATSTSKRTSSPESSSSSEGTTNSSDSSTPMIQIVQEITEERTITSTVHVNKKKVKSFQRTKLDRVVVSSKGKPKWKNKQKIIDDNVCNEILDETIHCDVIEGKKQDDAIVSSPNTDTILFGELKAKPKYSHRKMGKLMERRLSRVISQIDTVTLPSNRKTQSASEIPRLATPPAKPPRTFTSSSSKTSSESIGAHTATTLAIDDFHKSLTLQNSPQISPKIPPGGGWIFDKKSSLSTKPTCPTFDDINEFERTKKIGWVSSIPKREEFVYVLNMLNDEHPMSSKLTSANLLPEPQLQLARKEDIDQVDSALPPKPAIRRSKQRMSMELNDSICSSTPVKRASQFSSNSAPNSAQNEIEICKKCKLQKMKSSSVRKSFGKGAMKRTKSFFKASKNIWSRPKTKPMKKYENCSDENEYYDDLDAFHDDFNEETPSKLKSNTTAEFNTNDTPRIEKKTVKTLELTPNQPKQDNIVESPRRILDKFLTSVKRTPPKKPIRQSLVHKDITRSPSNNEEDNFNFNRVIESPKSKEKHFKLSPRKLFCTTSSTTYERPNEIQHNSYRSFGVDQNEDVKQCIVEYLRDMNDKIEHRPDELEYATVPRWRSRARTFSTSSDAIDYLPHRERVVQIDCHPEPIYSEIIPQPAASSLNHIMVNDDPKAIYTTVNKNRNTVKPIVVDDNEIHDANQEYISKSWNSLDQLSMNNNLADSILNMLELMKQQNLDESARAGGSQISGSDDFKLQSVGSRVKNSFIVEQPYGLTSEHFQKSAYIDADNTSTSTIFTESICGDVIRGDSVNNNIVTMIDQLENMDLVSTISLVEPETDDESLFNEHFNETVVEKDFRSRMERNSVKDPATTTVSTLQQAAKSPLINSASDRSKMDKIQSPLTSVPSMIEIPDQYMLKLTNQIIEQREILNQLKQAIKICRTTKEFECSDELVEAERLMLLSAKKEACAKVELTRIDYEENGLTTNPVKCAGIVTIKKIEIDLKSEEMLEHIFQLSYICVCSYRDQVVATHAQERDGNKVKFDDISLKISSLNSSFEIKIEVFVLRLPRPLRKYSHESKFHLNKVSKKPLFLNPVKLFSNSSISPRKSLYDSDESRFRLRGVSTISAKSLSSEKFEIVRNTSWPKNHFYISYNTKSLNLKINDQFANLTGTFRMEFICEVNLIDSALSGFISISEDKNAMREFWCRLSACTLELWKNEIDYRNTKSPNFSIDLIKSTNETIEVIDSNKFAVDVFNEEITDQAGKNRINRYWISAFNQNDLILWSTEFNRILRFIKDWNI